MITKRDYQLLKTFVDHHKSDLPNKDVVERLDGIIAELGTIYDPSTQDALKESYIDHLVS